MNRQKLVCLLPARNCQSDLPEYLAAAERFADAIVALDDGSGDRTRELLEAHPLVQVVLANRPRATYTGWDDGANRNWLLEAAAALDPDWILSFDADERLDAADALALREFLEGDAVPGFAYGFRVFRMLEGSSACRSFSAAPSGSASSWARPLATSCSKRSTSRSPGRTLSRYALPCVSSRPFRPSACRKAATWL